MREKIQQKWQQLKSTPAGMRFQERYHRLQEKRQNRSQLKKIFSMLGGVGIILFGVFLWFVPGPGWITIFVGLAIIAGESLAIARFLDWSEVKLRKCFEKTELQDNI
jgi:O-antigen/teichoic acid export membrane protein